MTVLGCQVRRTLQGLLSAGIFANRSRTFVTTCKFRILSTETNKIFSTTFNKQCLSLNVLSEYSYNIYTIGSNLVEVIYHVITAPSSLRLLTVGGEPHLLGPHLRRPPLSRRQALLLLPLKLPPPLLGSLEIKITLSALWSGDIVRTFSFD